MFALVPRLKLSMTLQDTMVANDVGSEEVHSAPSGFGSYVDEDPFDARNREGRRQQLLIQF